MERFIKIFKNSEEFYKEDLSITGEMFCHLRDSKKKLEKIRLAMPLCEWDMEIEEQFMRGKASVFRIVNVDTGKLQEEVL